MKDLFDLFKRGWLVITGVLSSWTVKGISDLKQDTSIMDATEMAIDATHDLIMTTSDHTLLWYGAVGAVGALGGLLIRVLWGCLKMWFPSLQKIDPDSKK